MEKKPTTKRYPPELKERAVRMVHDLESGPSAGRGRRGAAGLGQAGRRANEEPNQRASGKPRPIH
jgi:transposase-like protein